MVVEVREKLLGIVIDIIGLFQQTRAEKIIENLPELWVLFKVADVLLLDGVLDGGEVGLELGVEVFVVLHVGFV